MRYKYGGLLIESPPFLHGVPHADPDSNNRPDIVIRLSIGPLSVRRPISFDWKGRFGLVLERDDPASPGRTIRYGDSAVVKCAAFGGELNCICRDAAHIDILGEILTRRILPRLSNLHGRMPVHAAALAHRSGAVLLFGASRAGKSTLTAALAAGGWQIFSDDMAILHEPGTPHVWQTAPGVSVWEDSKCALALPDASCLPITGYDGKYWYAPPCPHIADPVRVDAIIFLANEHPGGGTVWHRTSGALAMMEAASQMVSFDPTDVTEAAAALERFRQLVSNTACYTLAYPRSYAMLPAVIDAVTAIQADARAHKL